MNEEDQQKRPMADISHLFLSNVRNLTGQGQPRPQRKPPGSHSLPPGSHSLPPVEGPAAVEVSQPQTAVQAASGAIASPAVSSIDLTPEEYAHVFGSPAKPVARTESPAVLSANPTQDAVAPVTALLGTHLGVRQFDRAREYARHLAASGGRIGLIDLDVSEFRLFCYDPAVEPGAEAEARPMATAGVCDPREIAESIEELNVDVDRWLLLLPNLRTPEAEALIRNCENWTLLTTCDHDGVVSAYRTIKSIADARTDEAVRSTRLSLATFDAAGDAEAMRVQHKLAGVCRQFLNLDLESETPVRYAGGVAEHPLMNCRVTRDKASTAMAPHWTVVAEMLARPRRGQERAPAEVIAQAALNEVTPPPAAAVAPVEPATLRIEPLVEAPQTQPTPAIEQTQTVTQAPIATVQAPVAPVSAKPTPAPVFATVDSSAMSDEVIDLLGSEGDVASIVSAILRRPELGAIECPVAVPGCPSGRLTVMRDRSLALVAVASRGLTELRSIGKAFQWMLENRALIAMAVPQFSIDTAKTPTIVLLVDQADISGDLLRPMMQAEHVKVHAYRTLRWAGRTGLLLEAA